MFMKILFLLMQLKKVKAELEEINNNPQGLLLEALHSAGYSGALANPLLAPEAALDRLHGAILEEFVAVSLSLQFFILFFFFFLCLCCCCFYSIYVI